MATTIKPAVIGIAFVLGIGAAHGYWTDRWIPSPDLQRSLARLDRFPMDVGDWRGESIAYEPEDMSRNGILGCVFRKYRNIRTGESVSLLLVCGRGGPTSVHTPDVCYTAAGYQQTSAQEKFALGESRGEFWKGYFSQPRAVVPKRLQILWSWSRDGVTWSAPDGPRYAFARYPAIYKMYIVHESPPQAKIEDRTSAEFLAKLLPALESAFGDP